MASHDSDEPNVEPSGTQRATEVQDEAAEAVSVELSIPANVEQHKDAPQAAGYVLTEPLGSGAYGQVWHAWQLRTRKEVAIKIFVQRSGLDWIFLQREVERLSRLDRHPHIVTLLDIGLDEEPPFYSMDLISGGSLDQFADPASTVDRNRALDWLGQICDALSYVHAKGLIHCDLKPANILLDGRDRVRVVDFGQSRVFTESAASMGTLFFMAPEQANLWQPGVPLQPDVRWDIYALGATLYAILVGRTAYATQENESALASATSLEERLACYRNLIHEGFPPKWSADTSAGVGEELIAIINKCMALAPDDRYASVSEIESDLSAMRQKRPITPLGGSARYRSKKFLQRNPFKVLCALVLVALVVALAYGQVRQARLDRASASELLATFVHDPVRALTDIAKQTDGARRWAVALTAQYASSDAYTDRIMAARAAPVMAPAAFWESVSEGPLWQFGEWLELIDAFDAEGDDAVLDGSRSRLIESLEGKLSDGSSREKYVALCLLGQLSPERAGLIDRCKRIVQEDREPGVVLAGVWAAKQLGEEIRPESTDRILVDGITGMIFVELPPASGFRRGSNSDDPHRFPDEDRSADGVDIEPVFMSSTEVTQSAFAEFFVAAMGGSQENKISAQEHSAISDQYKTVPLDDAEHVAMGGMTLLTARRYCNWLTEKGRQAEPARRYRLPTEDEWEYAARGGNLAGRFCFGDSVDYVRYFAHCDGSPAANHQVAELMPNFFGLFDMHGGVWEATDSVYPAEFVLPGDRQMTNYAVRGGAWYSPSVRCRSAQRNYRSANYFDSRSGLRLVMELDK